MYRIAFFAFLLTLVCTTQAFSQNPLARQKNADPFVGEFSDGSISLSLQTSGGGYTGTLSVEGQQFRVLAQGGGDMLSGTFGPEGSEFPLELTANDGGITLTTEGVAYSLARVGGNSANPLAGGSKTPASRGFTGTYTANHPQLGQVSVQFQQQGAKLTGVANVQGGQAQMEGTVEGTRASGKIADPEGMGTFEATLSGDDLQINVVYTVYMTGEVVQLPLQMKRGGAANPGASQMGQGGAPQGQLDQRLLGTWYTGSSYTSGDFSAATSTAVTFYEDGTLVIGPTNLAGGGDAGGFESGGGSGERHRWHVVGNILYVDGAPYGRYAFTSSSLGIWEGNNEKPTLYSRN